MRLTSIITAIVFAALTISCDSATKQDEHAVDLELNNGEKWIVNEEMKPFVLEAKQKVSQYDNGDYTLLAEQIKEQNQGLIKSCTMTGESHDELHKWLEPHLKLTQELADAKNEKQAKEIVAQIEKSFETYNAYFQ